MPEPHILIDATAVPADRGGVGRYVDSLVAALDRNGARLTVVCQDRDARLYDELAPRTRVIRAADTITTRTSRLLWEQTSLPGLVRKLGVDVVHSPHYTMPLASRAASVVTLHDATFFTDAALHSPLKSRFFRTWTTTALRYASRCVVPSAATAGELIRLTGTSHSRLEIVAHGVDEERFYPPSPEEIRAAREMIGVRDTGYVAFLGSLEPRKNVPALIEGFARALAGEPEPLALVLAGQSGWDRRVEAALDAASHRLRIIRAGYLPVHTLAGFLAGAELVAYPSLGEGFGLPVLEAMASGACVLTTPRLALPEVGRDAVAYCEVGADDIAAKLRGLLNDPARRAVLAEAAQRRAKEFSWTTSAEQHQEVYDRAWRQRRGLRV